MNTQKKLTTCKTLSAWCISGVLLFFLPAHSWAQFTDSPPGPQPDPVLTEAAEPQLDENLAPVPESHPTTGRSAASQLSQFEDSVASNIRDLFPASLKGRTILTLEPWQWISLLVLLVLAFVLDRVLEQLARPIAARILTRINRDLGPEIVRRTGRPFALVMTGVITSAMLGVLGMPPPTEAKARIAAGLVTTLAVIWVCLRLADLVGELLSIRASRTTSRMDDLLVPLIRKSAKILIAAVGALYVLSALNITFLPLLTGLGIGGLAIAFAAQNTVENFFGSMAVILDRPFDVGDWVKIDSVEGTVEELGFRSTRLRTAQASEMTIPNATLVKAIVDNMGRRRFRPWKTFIGLTYETPPDRIEVFCEEVRKLIALSPHTRKEDYHVRLHVFSPSSLDVLVQVQFTVGDFPAELEAREELMLGILTTAKRLNIDFAYPTQTVYTAGRPLAPA